MLAGERPRAIHNNCSGKHAGMLAAALQLGLDPGGYERPDHPLQQEIKRILSESCGVDLDRAEIGIDGCSVPTFALPLASLATGFARLGSGAGTWRGSGKGGAAADRRLLLRTGSDGRRRALRHRRAARARPASLQQRRRRRRACRGAAQAWARGRAQDRRRRQARDRDGPRPFACCTRPRCSKGARRPAQRRDLDLAWPEGRGASRQR